jgi:hypothetical protein
MQLLKLTVRSRNGKILPTPEEMIFDIDNIKSVIFRNGEPYFGFLTLAEKGSKILNSYTVIEDPYQIAAQSQNLLVLRVVSIKGRAISDTRIFDARKIVDTITVDDDGNSKFLYQESDNPNLIEYVVSDTLTEIYDQNAVTGGQAGGGQDLISFAVSDETTGIVTANDLIKTHAPFDFTLDDLFAGLTTVIQGGAADPLEVDIKKNGVSIFGTTKLMIDPGEETSLTAASQPSIATTSFVKGDAITVDVLDGSDNTATGLKIYMNVTRV